MGCPGQIHEITEVVNFLALSGSYVTGAVIMVDGTWLCSKAIKQHGSMRSYQF